MRIVVWAYIETLISSRFHKMPLGFFPLRPLYLPLLTYVLDAIQQQHQLISLVLVQSLSDHPLLAVYITYILRYCLAKISFCWILILTFTFHCEKKGTSSSMVKSMRRQQMRVFQTLFCWRSPKNLGFFWILSCTPILVSIVSNLAFWLLWICWVGWFLVRNTRNIHHHGLHSLKLT